MAPRPAAPPSLLDHTIERRPRCPRPAQPQTITCRQSPAHWNIRPDSGSACPVSQVRRRGTSSLAGCSACTLVWHRGCTAPVLWLQSVAASCRAVRSVRREPSHQPAQQQLLSHPVTSADLPGSRVNVLDRRQPPFMRGFSRLLTDGYVSMQRQLQASGIAAMPLSFATCAGQADSPSS